jgi:L-iditol 2-dehydrogenase
MKAAVKRAPARVEIEEWPLPELQQGEVLVRVKSVGICGSDLHGWTEENSKGRPVGLIMGHEASGIVEKVAPGVSRVAPGDRVAVDPQIRCGVCKACVSGYQNICEKVAIIGSALRAFRQGALAEYVAVPERQLFRIPDALSFEDAAVLEPLANALHVARRIRVDAGSTVLVIGAGTLGLAMIQAAALSGATRIIVSDLSDFRLSVAKSLGATVCCNSGKQDLNELVSSLTDGKGADAVIEAVGISATYQQAIKAVRRRGWIAFFGAVSQQITVDLLPILHKEINIAGCTGFTEEFEVAIALLGSGVLKAAPLVTHVFPLDQAQKGFETMADQGSNSIKVLVNP